MGTGGAGNKSKHIFRQFPIIRFYGALALSLVYFLIQLVVAHLAHSLILQIDAYHMLYNILSLTTCIVSSKASSAKAGNNVKNTFGWRRIDVCGAVANLCFLAALGFSVVVESLQTIAHASHHEKMHYPLAVGVVGILGLLVNFVVFFLIGGYTLHQSVLSSAKDGRGDDSVISATMRRGPYDHIMRERQGAFEMFRDIFGCVLVVVCAIVVQYWTDTAADYVDPCLTIGTVLVLGVTSYKYAKDAGYILLLTIPDHINVSSLQSEMKDQFPDVSGIHEFHIWQLTPARIIASVHVVFQKPQGYLSIQNKIIHFLHEKGITHVTMQPEFRHMTDAGAEESGDETQNGKCFLSCCSDDECHDLQCCNSDEDHDHDDGHDHGHSHVHGHSHTHNRSTRSDPSSSQAAVLNGGGEGSSKIHHADLVDISLDDMNVNDSASFNSPTNHVDESDLSDDEQVKAELRPMI